MLHGLARWLRAAGHDTAVAEAGATDRMLIDQARLEGRLLITRDRKLLEFREAPDLVLLLSGDNGTAGSARELTARIGLDWLYRPFTRCLVCNELLEAAAQERWQEVPERSRLGGTLNACEACGRLYWEGGHVRRMRARLERWRDGEFA